MYFSAKNIVKKKYGDTPNSPGVVSRFILTLKEINYDCIVFKNSMVKKINNLFYYASNN